METRKDKNPFMWPENVESLSKNSLINIKENSAYIWRILIKIIDHGGSPDYIPANYDRQIESGRLLHTVTKQDNATGEKLKALKNALKDEENREKFLGSQFYEALRVLRNGSTDSTSDETWINYHASEGSYWSTKGALSSALISYKDDDSAKIGIDMDAFLDTIIKKDSNGKYVLTDISSVDGELLIDAVAKTIDIMKNSEKFRNNFKHNEQDESEIF